TGLLAAICLGLLYSLPPDPKSLALDRFSSQRFARFELRPPAIETPPATGQGQAAPGGRGAGHPAAGAAGVSGRPTATHQTGLFRLRGEHPDPRGARLWAEEAAQSIGVLGQLRTVEASHIGSLFGPTSALGSDADNVMAGLIGTEVRESWGTGIGM